MSAATTTSPVNEIAKSAAEYVRKLSDEEKGHVLIALLRELIAINGGGKGLISIDTAEGESLGYYVPPLAAAARADAVLPKLTGEEEAELDRLSRMPGIPAAEVVADLKARLAALETQKRGPCEPKH